MGFKMIRSKAITVHENEEKDVKFKLQPEIRGVIHGVLVDPEGKPVKDAVVKLFQKKGSGDVLKPITFQFTDKYGQFLFYVDANVEYILKMFYYEEECTVISKERNCNHQDPCNEHFSIDDECTIGSKRRDSGHHDPSKEIFNTEEDI